jgi:hypothetical protein
MSKIVYVFKQDEQPIKLQPPKLQPPKLQPTKPFESYITSRGDVVLQQISENSCHVTSSVMVAQSKGFVVPDELIVICLKNNKIYDSTPYQQYAALLHKKLVIKEFPYIRNKNIMTVTDNEIEQLVSEIEQFVHTYGVCCISSFGHLKVIDDVITDNNNKKYLIIRDPYAFIQFIYDTSPDTKFKPWPTAWNHRHVMMINEVFTFV